jgi:hypothetical protein
LHREQLLAIDDRLELDLVDGPLRAGARARPIPPRGRVADADPQQEAVELCLRQRVGAFVLDRVLGREDEEGPLQRAVSPSIVTCRSCIASSSAPASSAGRG